MCQITNKLLRQKKSLFGGSDCSGCQNYETLMLPNESVGFISENMKASEIFDIYIYFF